MVIQLNIGHGQDKMSQQRSLDGFKRAIDVQLRASMSVILPYTKRFDHISPALKKLHWLPIQQRILFKIATITYKTLQNKQPSYLYDLLQHHNPSRSLRSASQHLLIIPRIDSANGRRSFSFSSPAIWNSLPLSIRLSPTLSSFRSAIKTHFFPP